MHRQVVIMIFLKPKLVGNQNRYLGKSLGFV